MTELVKFGGLEKAFPEGARVTMRENFGGPQMVARFPNNWGISVVRHMFSYGVEMAVIGWNPEDSDDDFTLSYRTPVTDDVVGWMGDAAELARYTAMVADLEQRPVTVAREVGRVDFLFEWHEGSRLVNVVVDGGMHEYVTVASINVWDETRGCVQVDSALSVADAADRWLMRQSAEDVAGHEEAAREAVDERYRQP